MDKADKTDRTGEADKRVVTSLKPQVSGLCDL
jgi:hypothetical protein